MALGDHIINLMLRSPASFASRVRIVALRVAGARIGRDCRIESIQLPRNPWDIELADGVALDRDVVLLATGSRVSRPKIAIGQRTYINRWTMIDASLAISIGKDVMIGPSCYITDHDHGTRIGTPVSQQQLIELPTSIGNNVWIGANVTILKGVSVGNDAVIAAGSVVTKDVAPSDRVAGVPARSII
jgi:acetyltransferase-like isoleucine patch superfamily enzyme